MHYNQNQDSLFKSYFYALIPLLIFGFYKNGLLAYYNNLTSFATALIPLYFYLISVVVGFLVSLIIKDNYKFNILTSLIISASISLNTNMLIYPILLFVLLFISNVLLKKYNINWHLNSLIRLAIILSLFFNAYSYLNLAEKLELFNYNLFDKFLGFTPGGIASSSLALSIFALIILSFNKFYKKTISYSAIISYILTTIILIFIFHKNSINIIFEGYIYFNFIFLGADIYVGPATFKGMLIYGLIMGILAAIFLNFSYYEGVYLSILISSFFIPLINKLTNKKYLQKDKLML